MGQTLFQGRSKRLAIFVLVVALGSIVASRALHTESDEVDPAIKAKADKLRSEIQDYAPPENNMPDKPELPPPKHIQPSTKRPKSRT